MRVLVVGLGASGGAAVRACAAAGWSVVGVDQRPDLDVPDLAAVATVVLGAGAWPDVADHDLLVVSPGVPPTHPLLAAAAAAAIPVWSEPELAWHLNAGRTRLVAVTGTNGKTTTTEMIAACLGAPAAGNIGLPLVDVLAADTPPPLVVAELSSFQLHHCHELRPEVAAIGNVADDHLDWHGGFDGYLAAKARLWQAQTTSDTVVADVTDAGVALALDRFPPPGTTRRVEAGEDAVLEGLSLRAEGPHNRANAAIAAHAALAAGAAPEGVRAALEAFAPGPHRLEVVVRRDGVTWVNDSKATNPHAARAALASFADIVWIAGGLNKGLSFDLLAADLPGRVRLALTVGECGPEVAAMVRGVGVPVEEVGTIEAAVRRASEVAVTGTTVLLAPAAASMDQFTSYAERGEDFRRHVEALA